MKLCGWIAALVCCGVIAEVPAQVRVTKSMSEVSTLDISGFVGRSGGAPAVFRQTLEADLVRSGWFNLAGGTGRAEFSLLGEAVMAGAGLKVRCEAYNVASRARLLGRSYQTSGDTATRLAHKVADEIVLALTGRQGMASSRFLLIGDRTGHKEVYMCDADGRNLRQLTRDNTISMAPKWSPDGGSFVYTSFRARFPDVYLVNLATGSRKRIAHYPGLNAGAAFAPDGRALALILSKDGNPELYVKNISSGGLTRLTNSRRAAEASPTWSPDGSQIAFVSDRSGSPQIYAVARAGGAPRRLTSRGSQNVDPDWGANGYLAYCSYGGGGYQIVVMNPATLEFKQVTPGDADYEDPSWAPDGRHIACTRTVNYSARIFMVDTLGGSLIPLLPDCEKGGWFAPSWSQQ